MPTLESNDPGHDQLEPTLPGRQGDAERLTAEPFAYSSLRTALERRNEIRLAYLFGSFAQGTAHDRSDVDVAVLASPPLGLDETEALVRTLSEATGRSVDLVDLERAPPLLLREIIAGGQVVACQSEAEQADFELRAIARYLDTQRLRDVQRMYLQQRVRERFGPQP